MVSLTQSHQPVFTVSTPLYEGPLDLLLSLIERAELDITRLALTQVTSPFLAYVKQLQNYRPDEVSGFLLIAARLMQIKSESLLPRPVVREPGEEDPGEDLVQQLILYKKYKAIASILKDREELGLKTHLRLAAPPKIDAVLDLSGISLTDLHAAARRVFLATARQDALQDIVNSPPVTIREKIGMITSALKSKRRANFSHLLGPRPRRLDIVVTFLALLELIKQFQVQAHQVALFAEIEIEAISELDTNSNFEIEFRD